MKQINFLLNNKKYKEALGAAEKEIYLAAYEWAGRNQSQTAKLLNVSRGTLITKLKEWGVERPIDYKERMYKEWL